MEHLASPHPPRPSRQAWRTRVGGFLAGLVCLAASATALAQTTNLVFLVDGSGSISDVDWQIQKTGISAALQDPLAFPRDGSIAIGVVQWSFLDASSRSRTEIPLTVIDNQTTLEGLVAQVEAIGQIGQLTNPGDGIRHGTDLLLGGGGDPATNDWILCMSTDGVTNSGEALTSAAGYATANGVDKYSVIGIEDPPNVTGADLRGHYGPHVFGGGAVTIARNATEFASLIVGSCLGDAVTLRALEVNQAVQDWQNSVSLVSDKATTVRAFVEVAPGEDEQRVVGRLFGTRGGATLPGSPLLAINPGSAVRAAEDIASRRHDLDDSLNFPLPASWRSGTVELEFEAAGAPVDCQEPAGPGSDAGANCTVTVSFTDESTPEIVFVGVRYASGGTAIEPTTAELLEQFFRFRSILPVESIDFRLDAMGAYTSVPDLPTVNTDLATKRLIDVASCVLGCSDPTTSRSRYYGLLAGNGGGLANGIPGTVSSGFLSGSGARNATGYARNRGPHELAHSLGRHHAVDNSLPLNMGLKVGRCGEVADAGAPGHTPFETVAGVMRPVLGPLASGADAEVWGLDTRFVASDDRDLAVIDPRATFELMSYCGGGPQGRWISAFTYEGLRGAFPTATLATSAAASSDFVVVTGTIDLGRDVATVGPSLQMTGNPPSPVPGRYEAQLLDGGGAVLSAVAFEPEVMDADVETPGAMLASPIGLISVPVPRPAGPIASVRILHDGLPIGELVASATAPLVAIVSPAGGETLTSPSLTFLWTASDPDGGALASTVLYSNDDGDTWTTLAVNIDPSSLTVPRSDLPASDVSRLRVIVSDGVNSTTATSNRFAVSNNPPIVQIDEPAADGVFSGFQNVDLTAVGVDVEDHMLPGVALTWSSDLDGPLGSGTELNLNASTLREGTHQISVMASDTQGAGAEQAVAITVFRVAPPPDDCDAAATFPSLVCRLEELRAAIETAAELDRSKDALSALAAAAHGRVAAASDIAAVGDRARARRALRAGGAKLRKYLRLIVSLRARRRIPDGVRDAFRERVVPLVADIRTLQGSL